MKKLYILICIILIISVTACDQATTLIEFTSASTETATATDTDTVTETENIEDSQIVSNLRLLLDSYSLTSYFSYNSDSEAIFNNDSGYRYSIYSKYEVFYDNNSLKNMFHLYSETHNVHMSTSIYSDDIYFYYDPYGLNLATFHEYITDIYIIPGNEPEWEISYLSNQEQIELGYSNTPESLNISNILNGIHDLDYIESDSYNEFDIPLTESNFSIGMIPEILLLMNEIHMLDIFGSLELISIITEKLSMIDLCIRTNTDFTEILSIKLDLTDLANDLQMLVIEDLDTDVYSEVYVDITDLSTEVININSPFLTEDNSTSDYYFYDLDGEVIDAYIDTDNKLVIYSVVDDKNLYFFNYESHVLSSILFEIEPSHITGDNDYIYVTLSDQHERRTDDPEYGGIAIVDAANISVVKTYDYTFDPFDLAVDNDGFLYVTHGSNGHGYLRGIDSSSGEIVYSRSGFYYQGQIVYSPYTNRIYYTEVNLTSDELQIFDVDHGTFGIEYSGSENFTEENLTVSPDGHYIYSLDGKIFLLNPVISEDGIIWRDLELEYNSVSFNMADSVSYFALANGIYEMNSSGLFTNIYKYGLSSVRMQYDDGLIINIGYSHIEIIDTGND